MKNDISKKTAPKVLKQEKMNENSAIFTLTGIKIHARTYRSDEFPCSRSARKWSQIHYPDLIWKELCGKKGNLTAESGCNNEHLRI